VVLLNDDTVVGPGWLSRLVGHLERDPSLGLVCPMTNEIGNEAKIGVHYADLEGMEALALDRAARHAGERLPIETVALFCAAARRSDLERAGFLDERYAVGMFEDDDLSLTLRRAGRTLGVALDAFVHHVGHASFARFSDAEYLAVWDANRRRFEEKWQVKWSPPSHRSGG
jgi:GT2 family glycosyltransferase